MSRWCQVASALCLRSPPSQNIGLIYAESARVTDGIRTRDLRSHNPPTSVAWGCPLLQNRLRYAESFARGCARLLRVALWVVSKVVSNSIGRCGLPSHSTRTPATGAPV